MSNSNLELNDLTKFRLDEINKIKDYLNAEIKERRDIVKKLVTALLLLIMQTNFLLHYLHRLALEVLCHIQRLLEYLLEQLEHL